MKASFGQTSVGTFFRRDNIVFLKLGDEQACAVAGPRDTRGQLSHFGADSEIEALAAEIALATLSSAPAESSMNTWTDETTREVGDFGHVNTIQVFAGLFLSTGVSKGYYYSGRDRLVYWCDEETAQEIAKAEAVPFVAWRTFKYTTTQALKALARP